MLIQPHKKRKSKLSKRPEEEFVAFLISGVSGYAVRDWANVGARATFQCTGKSVQSSCRATDRARLNFSTDKGLKKLVV